MTELKTKLKEILVTGLKLHDVTIDQIKDDDALFEEGLGLDSLDAVELVVLINKHFGIQIQDMEEGKIAFTSINSLAQYINDKQQQ